MVKILLNTSWISSVIRITIKIECFVASETTHPPKWRQFLELSAEYTEFSLSHIVKNSYSKIIKPRGRQKFNGDFLVQR